MADDLSNEGDERRLRDRARDARERAVEARRQAEVRIRQEGERRDWVHVLLDTYDRDQRRAGGLLSGGLAFRLFVWSLPFALVLVTSLGFLVDSIDHTVESLGQGSGLSATIVDAVSKGVEASSRNRFALLLLGLVLLFMASTSGLRALNVVSIIAWELEPRAPRRMVAGSIAFALTITGLVAIHLVANPFYGGGFGTDILATAALTAADTAVAYAALSRLPHGATGRWGLLPGALLFGVGIEVLRLVTAVYLVGKMERIGDLYGSLGLAVVILGWLFIIGRLVVTGCMLNASVAYGRLPAEPKRAMEHDHRSTRHRMRLMEARDRHVRLRVRQPPGAVVLKELSPTAEDVLGFPTDEWFADAQLWQRLLHPEDAARVIAATWRTTFQGVGYDETYRMITRDSRIVWVRDRAEVERLPDGSEVWRGSWTVVPEPVAAEASDAT